MQSVDVQDPGMPDLQFVLLVLALSTSDLKSLNLSVSDRETLFNRCWVLLHETPPPEKMEERVLDLRQGDELTLDAMVQVIKQTLAEQGISHLTWDHPPSEPTRRTTPEAEPLVERFQKLYPIEPDPSEPTQPGTNS